MRLNAVHDMDLRPSASQPEVSGGGGTGGYTAPSTSCQSNSKSSTILAQIVIRLKAAYDLTLRLSKVQHVLSSRGGEVAAQQHVCQKSLWASTSCNLLSL